MLHRSQTAINCGLVGRITGLLDLTHQALGDLMQCVLERSNNQTQAHIGQQRTRVRIDPVVRAMTGDVATQ